MKYFLSRFNIDCSAADTLLDNNGNNSGMLMQACRELLADGLGSCGYESFIDTDEGLDAYVQQEEYHEILVKEYLSQFPIEGVDIKFKTEEIPDQDWNATWEADGFEPIDVDGMVTIYDARNTEDAEQFSAPVKIGIHARNAFGTGTHETTRMIISMLLSLPLEGKRILDCGCGTGILSIVAKKMGAEEVVSYDIDEWSVENTQHNAELNNVELEVLEGDKNALTHVNGLFDVVMANINRNILLDDMQAYEDVMQLDGIMILSGFYEQDAPILLERAEELGLKEKMRLISGDWCCLVLSH